MNLETKVGLFVLLGLAVLGVSVMTISNLTLQRQYRLHFIFEDVQGLNNKSQVRIAGVEVGQVEKLALEEGRAKVTAKINKDIAVFENADVRVKLVGLIGSQFLDLDPGTPEARRLNDGDVLYGKRSKSLNDLVEKLSELIEGKPGKPGIGENLSATMANLRNISGSLNSAIGMQRDELKGIVKNMHEFTVDLKGISHDVRDLTSKKKEDLEIAITKLRSILERTDEVLAKVQRGEGPVGRLLADKEMGDEVKKTVTNLKETSESAKEVLGRFTKMRTFWELQLRSVPQANGYRADAGVRIQPRPNKYYYLGVSNIGDREKSEYREEGDYERRNTIDALLGKVFGPVTVEVGSIRSSFGVGLRYYPLQFLGDPSPEEKGTRWYDRIEISAQGFEFGRDEIRGRAGRERRFKSPQFNAGASVGVTRFLQVGAGVEDLAEVKQYNIRTRVIFEDRDLAYLFGFVSFAR